MKIFYLVIISIFTNIINSQNIKIQIVDQNTEQNLDAVLIFHNEKLISVTDKMGIANLEIYEGLIEIVKEGYIDTQININKIINNKIYLTKNLNIQLEEITIKKENKKNTLDSIYFTIKNKKIYSYPKYYHNYNIVTSINDTLLYLNERLQFDENKGFYVDIQNKFIKKFIFEEVINPKNTYQLIYNLKNKKIAFPKTLSSGYIKIDYYQEFTDLYNKANEYVWEITNYDEYSKLTYYPKNKNNKFSYKGHIIYNQNDFGILEFKMELIKNSKNFMLSQILNEKSKHEYLLQSEIYIINYNKINNRYYFKNSSNNIELLQVKGNFKDQIFIKKSLFEETEPFELKNKKKLDIHTYGLL